MSLDTSDSADMQLFTRLYAGSYLSDQGIGRGTATIDTSYVFYG